MPKGKSAVNTKSSSSSSSSDGEKSASAGASTSTSSAGTSKITFREKLLKTAADARASRPKKTAEDFARARDIAFDALVYGDKNEDNTRKGFELNAEPMCKRIENSAIDGFTSAIIYTWNYVNRPSNRAWTFDNVRLRDLLFRRPSNEAGFKDNETLLEKLQNYIDSEFGEGFKLVFKTFGGKVGTGGSGYGAGGSGAGSERQRNINKKFQLTIMWGEPRDRQVKTGTEESDNESTDDE